MMEEDTLYAVFLGTGGWSNEADYAKKDLTVGQEYKVDRIDVGRSSSCIYIEGFGGSYNSVMFDYSYNGEEYDYISNPLKLENINYTYFQYVKVDEDDEEDEDDFND